MDRVEVTVWIDGGIREQADGEKTYERLYEDGMLLPVPPPTGGPALRASGLLRRRVRLGSSPFTLRLNVSRDFERSELQPLHRLQTNSPSTWVTFRTLAQGTASVVKAGDPCSRGTD